MAVIMHAPSRVWTAAHLPVSGISARSKRKLSEASKTSAHQDPDADRDQDEASENGSLTRQPHSDIAADPDPRQADDQGHSRDDQGSRQRLGRGVGSDRKSHRQGIDRSGDPLDKKLTFGDAGGLLFLPVPQDCLHDHLSPDEQEQDKGNDRNGISEH